MKFQIFHFLYTKAVRPIFFLFDPEIVHDTLVFVGSVLGSFSITRYITKILFNYESPNLEKELLGIKFKNPIGLSAGFDYDGKVAKILPSVGFGFNTIGTVTNIPYEGNPKPRLVRLIKSKSILVNKGFKSEGVDKILQRINDPLFKDINFGVSVGSSNIPDVDNIEKAINDYCESFKKLETTPYIKYYELNISCPNTCLTENFMVLENFEKLLNSVLSLNIRRPIFIKMPNEGDLAVIDSLVDMAMSKGFKGFIFSNLAKNRNSKHLHEEDRRKIEGLKGNMSGRPTEENSNQLLRRYRDKYGKDIVLIGVGGVFGPKEAKAKFEAGADLVQMITGMIYEGPEIIGTINEDLVNKT